MKVPVTCKEDNCGLKSAVVAVIPIKNQFIEIKMKVPVTDSQTHYSTNCLSKVISQVPEINSCKAYQNDTQAFKQYLTFHFIY